MDNNFCLKIASGYAKEHSGCQKVVVGSVITQNKDLSAGWFNVLGRGANRAIPNVCDGISCNKLSPVDNKLHCVATIHSEIDAIINAACDLKGTTIYVTRYPCENCARAIVSSGIGKVVYGRAQVISEEVRRIFEWGNVEFEHESTFEEEDAI